MCLIFFRSLIASMSESSSTPMDCWAVFERWTVSRSTICMTCVLRRLLSFQMKNRVMDVMMRTTMDMMARENLSLMPSLTRPAALLMRGLRRGAAGAACAALRCAFILAHSAYRSMKASTFLILFRALMFPGSMAEHLAPLLDRSLEIIAGIVKYAVVIVFVHELALLVREHLPPIHLAAADAAAATLSC